MAILKNTTIQGTGQLTLPVGATDTRPATTTTVIRWTNTGTQAVSVVTGTTPTLTSTSWTAPTGVTQVEVLVVGGGGQGGSIAGGGAGGLIYTSAFTVTPGTPYTVTVGAGGSTSPVANAGQNGSNSVFGSLTAIGGGGGAGNSINGFTGGSGGGGGGDDGTSGTVGAATAGQGFSGGTALTTGTNFGGGAGGGAGGRGSNASTVNIAGGGGIGLNFSITGTPTWYAAGGGGGAYIINSTGTRGIGGSGIGGNGGQNGTAATNGTASTGSGGGGNGLNSSGNLQGSPGSGGSGVVVIRYTVANDSTDPRGSTRYNRELRNIEFYNDNINQWSGQNPAENFAFHNLLPYSQDWSQYTGNYFNNWINATVTAGQIDPFGGTGAVLLTGYYARISTSISVQPNKTYTFSVWLKNNALVNPVVIHIVRGLNGAQQGNISTSISAASIANWTRFSLSYTVPASGINQIQCGVGFGGSMSTSASGYSVFAYGGMLEESTTMGSYVATNGTPNPVPTQFGNYRVHTYTATGTHRFVPAVSGTVEVLVVGGGGPGGHNHAGGGGGGGVLDQIDYPVLAGVSYPVVVGAGGQVAGNSQSNNNINGGNSVFDSLVASGGGSGGNRNDVASTSPGRGGGSGGGGGGAQAQFPLNYQPGPPVPSQGNYGGLAADILGGGGGGAGSVGQSGPLGGRGGHGRLIDISGASTYYGGGGGGGYSGGGTGAQNGGLGGGGIGGYNTGDPGTAGTANTGGGGGGGGGGGTPGSPGGSGIVIVRYRYK